MSRSVHLTWDETFTAYNFGPSHPMAPVRVELAIRLAREFGLLDRPNVAVSDAEVATDDLLSLVHDPDYIQAVRRVSSAPAYPDFSRGLGTDDTPAFAGMHEASARVVGASVACAEAVWTGRAEHGVNLGLPAGTGDAGWLRAFHAVVPPLLEEFRPQVLVTQSGCDSHFLDPLGHLTLSVDAQRMSYAALHDLAHRYADGRWIATGGGGYEIVDVVPRAWTHLIAEAAGVPLDPATETPVAWRDYITSRLGRTAPRRMTDGRTPTWRDFSDGFDPADPVDRAVNATRNAAFPAHGILFHL